MSSRISPRVAALAAISMLAAALATACGSDPTPTPTPTPPTAVVVDLSGIEPLTGGYHFENWAIVGGTPVAAGKFNVDGEGNVVDLQGARVPGGRFDAGVDLSSTSAIVITIEPPGDNDAIPASTHYLAGGVSGASARLSVGHAAALGDDFSSASGSYILATPTNGDDTNENSGIWFLDPTGGPSAGLELPTLPEGWVYEGWVVTGGQPVTTGRFTQPSGVDQAAPFSGPQAGPPFPGEDFLMNAPSGLTFPTDISGGVAVISVEPEPDDSAAPFTLKPLIGMIPAEAADHFLYAMGNESAGLPSGTARVE